MVVQRPSSTPIADLWNNFRFPYDLLNIYVHLLPGRRIEAAQPIAIQAQASAFNPWSVLRSKEDKPPKGFEKFFRRDTDKKAKKKESKDEEKK